MNDEQDSSYPQPEIQTSSFTQLVATMKREYEENMNALLLEHEERIARLDRTYENMKKEMEEDAAHQEQVDFERSRRSRPRTGPAHDSSTRASTSSRNGPHPPHSPTPREDTPRSSFASSSSGRRGPRPPMQRHYYERQDHREYADYYSHPRPGAYYPRGRSPLEGLGSMIRDLTHTAIGDAFENLPPYYGSRWEWDCSEDGQHLSVGRGNIVGSNISNIGNSVSYHNWEAPRR